MTEIADVDISRTDVRTYREDGVVALRGVFAPHWIELLRDASAEAMAAPSEVAKNYAREGEGAFFTDHNMFQRIAAFRRFVEDSPAADIAAALMGSAKVTLYDEHLLIKEPGTTNPTYWHHDLPYFRIRGDHVCSLWIPFDKVTTATGAMRFVKGSHRWGKFFQPVRIGLGDPAPGADEFDGPVPDIDADPDSYAIVCHELDVGDCVAFHGLTLHSAGANTSATRRRRAIAYRFTGDDVTFHREAFTPIGLDSPELEDGGPLDSEQFPRVRG